MMSPPEQPGPAWIVMPDDALSVPGLSEALAASQTPHGTVDNVLRVHSLRPSTMAGHMALYRAVLHDEANTLPSWLQECVASWVSILNGCEYSLANHWSNARHLISDDARADQIERALHDRCPSQAFEPLEVTLFDYAQKLTVTPADMNEEDVEAMRQVGFDDGQILEVNQIVSYFNYVNRSINGLGVTTEGDVVGFYQ